MMTTTSTTTATPVTQVRPGMTGLLTLLFTLSAGVAVGNLYWAQPLPYVGQINIIQAILERVE